MKRRKRFLAAVALLMSGAVAVPAAFLVRGTGIKTRLLSVVPGFGTGKHPRVSAARPGGDSGAVPCNTHIAVDVDLVNAGYVIDAATVNSGSVRLIRKADRSIVPARVNTSAAGDALVLTPDAPLDPNSYYRFEVLPALKDTSGASFEGFVLGFTTSAGVDAVSYPVAFEKVPLPLTEQHGFTAVTVGPDRHLYGATYDGNIFRYELAADGSVTSSRLIDSLRVGNGGPRLITGITFDPRSTPESPVLYVSHGQFTRVTADEWTGKVSRLTGPNLEFYHEVLVGLPRACRDHLNNQMNFGPDGAMYLTQGSLSAMGRADNSWGNRPERLLSAAVLRVDLDAIAAGPGTLDLHTIDAGGPYDPFAPDAPVTLYATGLRSAYDMVFTRSGRCYAPINGSAAGGNTPGSPDGRIPAIDNVRLTIPDQLALVLPGKYYGHPNPIRNQYVLMGGNPSAGDDAVEINRYPVGTAPESDWQPPVAEFGQNISPNGIIEFHGSGPTAALDGALIVCRYSGGKDLCVAVPQSDGSIREIITGLTGFTRYADPLDLVQHPDTGYLYVAEFGGQRITLVRPLAGVVSEKSYRQPVNGAGRGVMDAPLTAETKLHGHEHTD